MVLGILTTQCCTDIIYQFSFTSIIIDQREGKCLSIDRPIYCWYGQRGDKWRTSCLWKRIRALRLLSRANQQRTTRSRERFGRMFESVVHPLEKPILPSHVFLSPLMWRGRGESFFKERSSALLKNKQMGRIARGDNLVVESKLDDEFISLSQLLLLVIVVVERDRWSLATFFCWKIDSADRFSKPFSCLLGSNGKGVGWIKVSTMTASP